MEDENKIAYDDSSTGKKVSLSKLFNQPVLPLQNMVKLVTDQFVADQFVAFYSSEHSSINCVIEKTIFSLSLN